MFQKREPFEKLQLNRNDYFTVPNGKRLFQRCAVQSWLLRRCGIDSKRVNALRFVLDGMPEGKFYLLLDDLEAAVGVESVEIALLKHHL